MTNPQTARRDQMLDFLHIETQPGQPIIAHGMRLLPFAQCMTLRFPVSNFQLIWNRPVSVLATDANGQEQVFYVQDVTRKIVWTLYGTMVIIAVLTALRNFKRRT